MVAGFSYLKSMVHKLPETNLENFYINRFGRKLYSMFFEGYTEKLWAVTRPKSPPTGRTARQGPEHYGRAEERVPEAPAEEARQLRSRNLPHRGILVSEARPGPAVGKPSNPTAKTPA